MSLKKLVVITILLNVAPVRAGEIFEFYRGARQEAMGGASIGVVDDETALLLNPAALARLRGSYLTLANPVVDLGSNDDKIAGGSVNLPKMDNPQTALTQCNANPGERLHGLGEIFPSLVFPNFGIGVLGRYSFDAEVNKAQTAYDFEFDQDFALVTGFSLRFWDGVIKLGVNGRLIDRTWISQPNLSPTATNLSFSSLKAEGMGFGSDAGLIITAPILWLPSLAAVVRDIGWTSYTLRGGIASNTATNPTITPQTFNGALSFSPILGKSARSMWTFEYDDITNTNKMPITAQHYHAGVEFNFGDSFFLRGGYNQGYWTAGVELAISRYELQLTSYGEEVGTAGAPSEDRRYVGSFSFRF